MNSAHSCLFSLNRLQIYTRLKRKARTPQHGETPPDSTATSSRRSVWETGSMSRRDAEGLMMMQELEDRLREHTDKLEHIRLAALELRDVSSGSSEDLKLDMAEHLERLGALSQRLDVLQMDTALFLQLTAKPRSFRLKQQGLRNRGRWGRPHLTDDGQSERGWSPAHTRRNSDAASDMSCAW